MSAPRSDRTLCRLDELRATGCREFRIGDGDWPLRGFVIRVGDGVRAYLNRCAHLSYPLNYLPDEFLSYDRNYIQCTMHGALFEKESGLCVSGPCLGRSLVALPARIENDAVVIDAGAIAHLPT
jgi:nitrite reductase/ring-hydroxylating ferredoxin subunit